MNNVQSSAIEVGRRVYCSLYYFGNGTIISVKGQPGVVPVQSCGGVMVSGGSCEFDVAWDNGAQSNSIPEALLASVQWKLLDEVVGPEAVAAAVVNSAIYKSQQFAKAEAKKAAKAIAEQKARAEGLALGLIPEDGFKASGKRGSAAAWNMRQELKQAGIKANVKRDHWSAIYVRVAEGDLDRAREIAGKYKAGSFDGMTDCYEYSPSAWGEVFGDVQYVFVDRN